MPAMKANPSSYDGHHTLVIGDVNTGKTRLTEQVLAGWVAQGRSEEIAVLDMGPQRIQTIGGRLTLPMGFGGVYLAAAIVPPRLNAPDEKAADTLAAANAVAIEPLLRAARLADCAILVINDVTLYLHAGTYDCLMAVVERAETALINAYYGNRFPDYRITRRERRLCDRLANACHRVIRMPGRDRYLPRTRRE